MNEVEEILLVKELTNVMELGGRNAWYQEGYNPSTGYHWECVPDNSGVYVQDETVRLYPSSETILVGMPGIVMWKFKAVRSGTGSVLFNQFAPGRKEPVTTFSITIKVR